MDACITIFALPSHLLPKFAFKNELIWNYVETSEVTFWPLPTSKNFKMFKKSASHQFWRKRIEKYENTSKFIGDAFAEFSYSWNLAIIFSKKLRFFTRIRRTPSSCIFESLPQFLGSMKSKESASHHLRYIRFNSLSASLEILIKFGQILVILGHFDAILG